MASWLLCNCSARTKQFTTGQKQSRLVVRTALWGGVKRRFRITTEAGDMVVGAPEPWVVAYAHKTPLEAKQACALVVR